MVQEVSLLDLRFYRSTSIHRVLAESMRKSQTSYLPRTRYRRRVIVRLGGWGSRPGLWIHSWRGDVGKRRVHRLPSGRSGAKGQVELKEGRG